jgi:ribonuclease R
MPTIEDQIMALLAQRKKSRFSRRQIADKLGLHGSERKNLTRTLNRLVKVGRVQERKGGYRLGEAPGRTLKGSFAQADAGYGFLCPEQEGSPDLFIPARYVGNAMDGDQVAAEVRVSRQDGRAYGRIVDVLQRAHRTLVGFYRPAGQTGQVWPLDRKLGGPIQIAGRPGLASGTVVEVEIKHFADTQTPARGRILEVLGAADDPQVDIETLIRGHNLPHSFSAEALAQAEKLTAGRVAEEVAGRTDLRQLPLVTIDSASARDFDDAVALRKEADGSYRLWVCIADVAHYVLARTPLDQDALERGTSVYFPGYCLPMLPEALSNGLCSLQPQADRLVMTVELRFDAQGQRLEQKFYPAVINSRARLTYSRVAAALAAPAAAELDGTLLQQLQQMAELAAALSRRRLARGSLDLELPEVEILLDESGRPCDLIRQARTPAHRLIEEFMLAANEAVAEYLSAQERGLLYRIHEPPKEEKLAELRQLTREIGLKLTTGSSLQRQLQQLLEAVADRPEARLLNQQLLRSLQQARYAPQNSGHFGLAAAHYCHFTSPIRRYPDLVVHRVLKALLAGQGQPEGLSGKRLQRLGEVCSARERRAIQAERDLIELRRCQVMAGRIGEEFDGIVSSVTAFGFFVELEPLYVEGLVHQRSLPADAYHFDPLTLTLSGSQSGLTFKLGQRVRVKVSKVELWRRRIDFQLVAATPGD